MSSIIIHNFSSANCDDFNIRIEKKINKQTKKKKKWKRVHTEINYAIERTQQPADRSENHNPRP